jgi:hypothetical protein
MQFYKKKFGHKMQFNGPKQFGHKNKTKSGENPFHKMKIYQISGCYSHFLLLYFYYFLNQLENIRADFMFVRYQIFGIGY